MVGEDTSGAVVLLGFPNMRLLAARSHCFRWFAVIEDVVDGFGSVAVVPGDVVELCHGRTPRPLDRHSSIGFEDGFASNPGLPNVTGKLAGRGVLREEGRAVRATLCRGEPESVWFDLHRPHGSGMSGLVR